MVFLSKISIFGSFSLKSRSFSDVHFKLFIHARANLIKNPEFTLSHFVKFVPEMTFLLIIFEKLYFCGKLILDFFEITIISLNESVPWFLLWLREKWTEFTCSRRVESVIKRTLLLNPISCYEFTIPHHSMFSFIILIQLALQDTELKLERPSSKPEFYFIWNTISWMLMTVLVGTVMLDY